MLHLYGQKKKAAKTALDKARNDMEADVYTKLDNRLPFIQISMVRSSSQYLVAASGQRRPARPSGALYILQSMTTCCTDCEMCPQAHMADS